MRITNLKVSGFRGLPEEREISFDGDVILLVGPNGRGKTSVLDAVLWALTGRLSRLGENENDVVSAYASTGEARVELKLSDGSNDGIRIVRAFDGEPRLTKVFSQSGEVLGEGQRAILEQLWAPRQSAKEGVDALESAITRAVYLQQDMVRQFIDADEDDERYAAVSRLVGAGSVNELQQQLDRSKQNWKTSVNKDQARLEELEKELSEVNSQLARLGNEEASSLNDEEWREWWQGCEAVAVDVGQVPALSEENVSNRIDTVMKQLGVIQQRIRRDLNEAKSIIDESQECSEPELPASIGELEDEVEQKSREVEKAETLLEDKQKEARGERRRLLEERHEREQLATMAEVALKHLEGRCPVCQQTHDREETVAHLQQLIEGSEVTEEVSAAEAVEEAESQLEELREELEDLTEQLEEARDKIEDHESWLEDRSARVAELGVRFDGEASVLDALGDFVSDQQSQLARIQSLKESGEKLALEAAKAGQESRRKELREVREDLKSRVDKLSGQVRNQNHTWKIAGSILEDLRDASTELTRLRLKEIKPILQRIYSRVDPHPSFRVVDFLVDFSYRKGRLSTVIEDPVEGVKSTEPKVVLSTSQMNALAISIFMSFNLGFNDIPLSCSILDDPIQSLDDVNLLGLVDLLRRVKGRRQLIVSTHDQRFGSLLARKLRPVPGEGQTIIHEFRGWSRSGPEIEPSEVAVDQDPVRAA